MKYLSTLIIVIFTLSIAVSQTNDKLYNSFKFDQKATEQSPFKILQPDWYLDSTYYFSYGDTTWNLKSKYIVELEDDRGNILQGITYEIDEDSTWKYKAIVDYTYHDNDIFETSLRRNWENVHWGDTVSFVRQTNEEKPLEVILNAAPNRRTVSEYNGSNLLQIKKEYRRANPTSKWEKYKNTIYSYNSDLEITHVLVKDYIDDAFVNSQYDTLIYENNELVNQKRYEWSVNDQWIPKYNVIYSKDGENKITTIQNWNLTKEDWENQSKKYVLYLNGVLQGTEDFNWTTEWTPIKKFTYFYNTDGWIVRTLYENWNSTSNSYDNFLATEYNRFEKDKIAQRTTLLWNKSNNTWKKRTMTILYWSEDDFHVDVEPISLKDLYTIYPNPTSTIITIKGADASITSKIYSIDGKLMRATQGNQIRVSDFPSGTYILKTNDGFVGEFVRE